MVGFRSASQNGLLELDEVSDVRLLPDVRLRAEVREWTDSRGGPHPRLDDHAEAVHEHVVSEHAVHDTHAGLELAPRADGGSPLKVDAGMQNAVRPHGNVRFDPRSRGIDDGDARGHELFVLAIAEVRRDDRQLTAAVDAENLGGIVENHRLDAEPALAIQADEVRQVILPLRVLGADGA